MSDYEDFDTRMARRRAEQQERLRQDFQGKRFRLIRRCVCGPDNMGWGCCCSQPLGVREDPEGDYVVVPYADTVVIQGVNYDGPDPSVECAYPPCTNRLRRVGPPSMSGEPHPQWCSKEHRELTKGHETCWSDWTAVVVDDYMVELTYPCGMTVQIANHRGVRVYTELAAQAHAQGLRETTNE